MNTEIRFGKPNYYDYSTLLDQFSGTKINSIKTSSIPLVQFWQNTDIRLNELLKTLALTSDNVKLCFEYPTPSDGKGKSSMTDLMIICDDTIKIAIEAKFTEYLKNNFKNETINKWLSIKNTDNRKIVLAHWTELIEPFSNKLGKSLIQDINYQFYHRTASACFNSNKAVVLYQVFKEVDSENDFQNYIASLKDNVIKINPNNKLSFYVWEIETKLKVDPTNIRDPFTEIKFRDIYEFGKTNIIKL